MGGWVEMGGGCGDDGDAEINTGAPPASTTVVGCYRPCSNLLTLFSFGLGLRFLFAPPL